MLPSPFFSRLAALVLALACVLAALPASAQDTAPASETPGAALAQLVDVLRDDTARAALIDELERLTAPPGDTEAEAEPGPNLEPELSPTVPSAELRSLGGRIADFTREAAQDMAASVASLWRQLGQVPVTLRGLGRIDLQTISDIIVDLAALLVITYGGFLLLRRLFRSLRARLSGAFADGGWIAKPLAVLLILGTDLAAVLLPWGLGYGVALGLLDTPGEISFPHSLYLNAFLMTEVTVAVIRRIVSPHQTAQRLVGLSSRQARLVIVWSRILVGLLIFGQMLALPLFNRTVSYGAGRAVSVLLLLALLALAALAVLLARGAVSRMLLRIFHKAETRRSVRGLIVYWHVPALLYLAGLALAALTRAPAAFQSILWANGQIAVAALAGVVVSNILGRMIGHGVHLPARFNQRVPLLEGRLNALIPATLRVLRFAVVAGVVIFCLHMLGLIDFPAFLESRIGARMTGAAITLTLIVFSAFALWLVVNAWVEYRISPDSKRRITSRERTLLVLLHNALTIAIIVVTLMVVLSELGLNIGPLLASAGVIGLAIGFGAQRLVQDIITGIFIQLEGAIDVGDVVSVAGISGVVERLTIRSVSLRDSEGSYHVVPFSTVAAVTNYMRGHSYAVIDVTVPYREGVETVKDAMFAAFERLKADPAHARSVIGALDWNGVNSFNLTEAVVRARVKTAPGKQWGVKRAFNLYLKEEFLSRFIGVPLAERPKIAEEAHGDTAPEDEKPEPPHKQAKPDIDLPDPDAGPDSRA